MTKQKFLHNLINVVAVFLFAVFLLFDGYTWGKFAFLAASLAIYVLGLWERNEKIVLRFDMYVVIYFVFIAYVLLTALWAKSAMSTITMARTLFRTFICAYIVYLYFVKEEDVSRLLRILMWAGYVVAIYSLMFYGVDELLKAGTDSSLRADNEFTNVNGIGFVCALSCMLQVNEFLEKRYQGTIVFMIPTVIVLAATQSRTALVMFGLGICSAFIVKNQNESFVKKFGKIIIGCVVAVLIIYGLLQLEIFSGIKQRMQTMFNSFIGNGKADSSALIRKKMIEIGWKEFTEHPIGGIGIANSYFITDKYLGKKTYLHNNFVELLSCGGIFAFIFYYAIYVYLFYNLWKYRNADKKQSMFFAIWLLIMLVVDFGTVSYYDKSQNFYLMIHFVNIQNLKKKAAKQANENCKLCEKAPKIYHGQRLSSVG